MSTNTSTGCAIITGSSRGIGRAIALALAEHWPVVVNYRRGTAEAGQVVQAIKDNGGKALALQADVSDEAQVATLFADAAQAYGHVAVLVNNAGVTKDGLLLRMPATDFDQVIDTNLKGAFLCTKQAALGMFRQRWGRIVNVASIAGDRKSTRLNSSH